MGSQQAVAGVVIGPGDAVVQGLQLALQKLLAELADVGVREEAPLRRWRTVNKMEC